MTPEQENELVARWMKWESALSGLWSLPHDWEDVVTNGPPPYRTDPALLWELMDRLSKWSGGNWRLFEVTLKDGGSYWKGYSYGTEGTITDQPTLAEAVFSAAVMQAGQASA